MNLLSEEKKEETKSDSKEQLLQINTKPKSHEHHESKEHKHEAKSDHKSKKPFYKNPFFYTAIFILILLAAGLIWYFAVQNSKDTLATVNGEKITQQQLSKEIGLLPQQYTAMLSKEQLEKAILDQLVIKKLLLQEAEKQKITVSDDELNLAIDNFLQSSGITKEDFIQRLNQQGSTLDQVKSLYKEQLLINKLLSQQAFANINFPEQQLQQYYDQNKQDLMQLRASHILICYKTALFCEKERTEDEAQKTAAELLNKIKAGESFDSLAKQYSDDPSANNGGDLGWFGKGDMVLQFEEASLKLSKDEVSPIVKTQFGFHIIKLISKNESFADLKQLIVDRLSTEQKQTAAKQYVDNLKSTAKIEYKN